MALGWEPNSPTRYSIDGSCMRVDRDGLSLVALAQLLDEVVNTKREVLQRFSPMDPTVLGLPDLRVLLFANGGLGSKLKLSEALIDRRILREAIAERLGGLQGAGERARVDRSDGIQLGDCVGDGDPLAMAKRAKWCFGPIGPVLSTGLAMSDHEDSE